MDNQKFLLWRLALSCVHLDGKVTTEELEWFNNTINQLKQNKLLHFTDEQIIQLQAVLQTPLKDFMEEFAQLSKPADKAFVLHILRIVAYLDHDFSQAEQQQYQEIEKIILQNVDMQEVQLLSDKLEISRPTASAKHTAKFETVFQAVQRILHHK